MYFSKFTQLTALLAIAAPVLASPPGPDSLQSVANFPKGAGASPAGAHVGSPRRNGKASRRCEVRRKLQARHTDPVHMVQSPTDPAPVNLPGQIKPLRAKSFKKKVPDQARKPDSGAGKDSAIPEARSTTTDRD
ncbi:hypothetical protein PspLS_11313 [Pyricularia sp. CBS 133598]|nr:hypothetical protein PspLS_11313 [Pyricularia sp. CBS 133598]